MWEYICENTHMSIYIYVCVCMYMYVCKCTPIPLYQTYIDSNILFSFSYYLSREINVSI